MSALRSLWTVIFMPGEVMTLSVYRLLFVNGDGFSVSEPEDHAVESSCIPQSVQLWALFIASIFSREVLLSCGFWDIDAVTSVTCLYLMQPMVFLANIQQHICNYLGDQPSSSKMETTGVVQQSHPDWDLNPSLPGSLAGSGVELRLSYTNRL